MDEMREKVIAALREHLPLTCGYNCEAAWENQSAMYEDAAVAVLSLLVGGEGVDPTYDEDAMKAALRFASDYCSPSDVPPIMTRAVFVGDVIRTYLASLDNRESGVVAFTAGVGDRPVAQAGWQDGSPNRLDLDAPPDKPG